MRSRFSLICGGMYPETLPPCFVSKDAKRAFRGLIGNLDSQWEFERKTQYLRYSGTKHDGNRRFFATPNIVSYFHVSTFIWREWKRFEKNFALSDFSVGAPTILDDGEERALKVPSLSELSKKTSKNIRYAPYILRVDIAQCFPSIYTHSIAWAVHGIDESKRDTAPASKTNVMNKLDFLVRNSQRGNTRGVLVGPDGYRLIAELVLSRIDNEIRKLVGPMIIGAVRHVDDFYIGLRSEHDAQAVLSCIREVLAQYELNLNDHKTKIHSSLDPINDLWAQKLRGSTRWNSFQSVDHDAIELAISEAVTLSREIVSDSPIKILLRAFDDSSIYKSDHWNFVEQILQRIVHKHPHAIDYACLLVAKRYAIGLPIDEEGWSDVAGMVIKKSLAFNHDHEVTWMAWLLLACNIQPSGHLCDELSRCHNDHVRAMLMQAQVDGRIKRKMKFGLGERLSSVDSNWLVNLVARSQGVNKSGFSGDYAPEFTHLANRNIRLIDFEDHSRRIKSNNSRAISRTRYGYDDDNENDDYYDADPSDSDETYPWDHDYNPD